MRSDRCEVSSIWAMSTSIVIWPCPPFWMLRALGPQVGCRLFIPELHSASWSLCVCILITSMPWTVRSCLCIATCMHFRTDALSLVHSPSLPARGHSTFEASDGQLNLQGSWAAISSRGPGQGSGTDHTPSPKWEDRNS